MLTVSDLSFQFGKTILFDGVNISFSNGNCYGIIGANGSGKSTFLKVLSGKLKPSSGSVLLESNKRISVLEQDHNSHDEFSIIDTVLKGNKDLYIVKREMDLIYAKSNFSSEDAERVGELQNRFEEMNGWNAESDASTLLSNIGISESLHSNLMNSLSGIEKVKVLLAQCIYGNPDVLIMDEPTNDLDYETINWLVDFLQAFENTVIVVSHDRHFLDSVCTHISDIDFGKITNFTGNYSFWQQSSQLILNQKKIANKKSEEKIKELKEFIARFSANVSKSKQATSRKKMLDKINIDEIKPSSRKYPGIIFENSRTLGDQILNVENLSFKNEDIKYITKISFNVNKGDKIALISKNSKVCNFFFDIVTNNIENTNGQFNWGVTTKYEYLPIDNSKYFNSEENILDWLSKFVENEEESDELYLRSFFGKMLFNGDEVFKKINVLSGGEKVRCLLSKIMMAKPNVLLLNEPTNHLDLESITAFNNALKIFKGNIIVTSQDFEFLNTLINRVIEITPNGVIDRLSTYEEYLNNKEIKNLREKLYQI